MSFDWRMKAAQGRHTRHCLETGEWPELKVVSPRKWAEFEIQACAYFLLRQKYRQTRGEVVCRTGTKHRRGARFDIVVFDDQETALLIIEVKDESNRGRHPSQCDHYSELTGLPVIHIWTMEQAKDIVAVADEALRLHDLRFYSG